MYLYGASGHAKVIIDILKAVGESINGLIDDNPEVEQLQGYAVEHGYFGQTPLIISIGSNFVRKKIAERIGANYLEQPVRSANGAIEKYFLKSTDFGQGKCDVIVTYCWNRVGYNILRSLARKGLNVWAADTSRHNICSMSRFASGSFVYPDPFKNETGFIDCLLKWVDELKPQMLLPTHDESLVIAKNREKFPPWLIIPIADYDLLKNLSNKKIATKLAKSLGIPTPKVYESLEEVEYPCVMKTVIGNSAKTVFFPNNKVELERLLKSYANEEILIEEKCGGLDYSVDCVRSDKICFASTYKSTLTKTKGGGTSTQREIVNCPELEEYAKRILNAVNYNGVCGIDFKYDEETNKIAFIEINARYTGGLATPVAAGFDIPYIHFCQSTKVAYHEQFKIQTGVKTKWILGDFITLLTRVAHFNLTVKELKQILNFRHFEAFDDWRNDDRKAFIGELYYYLNKLIKNRKLNP
jgi:predicted ATP-grasp superfamily ATP-dependent carboligase